MIEAVARGSAWLTSLPLAEAMRSSPYAYPAAEVVHIVGFAVLVGSIFVVDLRLLGAGRALPLDALMRHVLPWTIGSLLLVVPSGALLFIAHASELAGNPAFQWKLVALVLAGVNALMFHRALGRNPTATRQRLAGALSIGSWLAVVTAGRLIAYV
ncbi:hypothetical protein BH09PSE5_BH09PSE5_07560 [soil metagenome]